MDLGCGNGTLSYYIKEKTKALIVGTDISTKKLGKARHFMDAVLCDLEKPPPFRDGVFDFCFGFDVIEHLINIDDLFMEVHRILKNQGKFIVVTPNLASFVERILLLFGYQPQNIEVSRYEKFGSLRRTPPVGHYRGFTPKALTEMLEYHNFKIIKLVLTTYMEGMLKYIDNFLTKIRKTWGTLLVAIAVKR